MLSRDCYTPFEFNFREDAGPAILFLKCAQQGEIAQLRFVPQENGEKLTAVLRLKENNTWKDAKTEVFRFRVKGGAEGTPRETWINRMLSGAVIWSGRSLRVSFMGRETFQIPGVDASSLLLDTRAVERSGFKTEEPIPYPAGMFQTLDLKHLAADSSEQMVPTFSRIKGVPFLLWNEGRSVLSLKEAGWSEEKEDPSSFFENYDLGPAYEGDRRLPQVQAPVYDYVGAWVLARVQKGEGMGNHLTLRMGTRGEGSVLKRQFFLRDFTTTIPLEEGAEKGGLHLVYIPIAQAFAQDIGMDRMDIEITKEIRLARRTPDPNRFRWRPLGLPSGVEVAAITLVKSPVQLKIEADSPGALFQTPEAPAFSVRVESLLDQPQKVELRWRVEGREGEQTISANIDPEGKWTSRLPLGVKEPGHYTAEFSLFNGNGEPLLTRKSMFAVLPADERKYREESMLGTWDFGGNHYTPSDVDLVGSVMKKLGLRYGMFRASAESRAKYGVIKGNEAAVNMHTEDPSAAAETYAEVKKAHPDQLPTLLLFHEDAISAEHSNRPPDLFSGKPPYQLNDKEKERFGKMVVAATTAAKAMRAKFPNVKLPLGNGGIAVREEFYKAGFPSDLFDSAGNESMAGAYAPESQPPNPIPINSGLWMDRQLLDAYGYTGKPVSMCYEVIYPATTPGNLSYKTQADYLIRHLLHAMSWKPGIIRPGGITDAGNSYYHSNWGATGFLTAYPMLEPKPAAVALATLSRVLDGATYDSYLDTGSDSTYFLQFTKKDGGTVHPCWTTRGERRMTLEISGAESITVVDWDGKSGVLPVRDQEVQLPVSPSPRWVILPPKAIPRVKELSDPVYRDQPGQVTLLDSLDRLDQWEIESANDPLLERYNPLNPRRKGRLAISEDKGSHSLRINLTPKLSGPATVSMYAAIRHREGIRLPEGATDLRLQVNGNAGWGRIIYELKDATGQVWTFIGARAQGGSDWLADAIGRENSDGYQPGEISDWNTDDIYGVSRINFEGWGAMTVPLPGHYPGGYTWPANSQWRASGDGVVRPPFTLQRIIIEQSEKILYMKEYRAPRKQGISIRQLSVVQRPFDGLKDTPGTYASEYQMEAD